jgi:hypothetical protein
MSNYEGAPTTAMIGEKLLHLLDSASGRTFTKSQADDFATLADHYGKLKATDVLNGEETGDNLRVLVSAIKAQDRDAIRRMLTAPNGRKTRDGFGPVNEYNVQTSNETDEGTGLPGRKSLHTASWGDAVLAAGSRDGMKSIITAGSAAVAVPLNPEPVVDGRRVNFLRQLIPTPAGGGTTNGAFAYLRQTVRTNNAAVVPVGTRKPTSVFTLERVSDEVDTIAHLSEPIPRQWLDDAPLLRQFVDSELRHGLDLELDAEIVTAILAEAIDTSGAPVNSLPGSLGDIRSAIAALELQDLVPDGIAMSPDEWMRAEATALTEFASNPSMSPANSAARRLFGLPVVVTTALNDLDRIIVGAFASSSAFYMRQEARVDWSEATYDPTFDGDAGATDWERNLIRFRAEMRAKAVVTRPAGFVQIGQGS